MPETDPSDVVHDAINDFFQQVFGLASTAFYRFTNNLYESFAQVSKGRWTKVILSVAFYVIIRPYIEKFFRWTSDKDRKRREEKEKKEKEATGFEAGRKSKVSANSLRGGGDAAAAAGAGANDGGKVLGEVDNTDDEMDDEEEGEDIKFAKASGVPEWGKNARKRQKKQARNLAESSQKTHNLTDEQLMELLDWSESEGEKKE